MKGEKQKKQSKIVHDIIPPTIKKGLVVVEKMEEKMEEKISVWTKAFYLFLKTSKYGSAVLIFGIVLLGGTLIMGFSSKTEIIEIHPTQYEGDWQSVENGLERDLSDEADISEFNSDNSSGITGFEKNEEESSNDNVIPLSEENAIDEESKKEDVSQSENKEESEENNEINLPIKEDSAQSTEEEAKTGDTELIEKDIELIEKSAEVESVEESQEGSTQSMEPTEDSNGELSFFERTKNIFSIPEAKAEEAQIRDTEPTIGNAELINEDTEPIVGDVELMIEQEDLIEPIEEDSGIVKGDAESLESIEEVKENNQGEEDEKDEDDEEGEKFEDYSGTIIIPDVDGNLLFETEEDKEEEKEIQAIFTEEFDAIYSDFSVSREYGKLRKVKIGFSFASLGDEDEDDEIIVFWSLNDQDWNTALELVLNKNYSNKDNSGYFYVDIFDLSNSGNDTILDWDDIGNIKVKFSYLTNNSEENYVPFFLDAVWLETESEKTNENDEEVSEEIDGEEKIEILSHKKDFRINEELEFKFKYKKEKEKLLISIGEIFGVIDYWDDIYLTAEIISPSGEIFQVPSEEFGSFSEVFILGEDGEISIKLENSKKSKPGLYKIILKVKENGKTRTFEQDFTWGVLAINVNKSIYLPNEEVYLQMGVLKNDGHTVCDANLVLNIKYLVSSEETILSTADGTISYSGKCSGDNVTDVPDYFTYYTVGEAGAYEMKLTNLDNGYEIKDTFEVRDSVPFEIERVGPSRIYPLADYEMVIKIKINESFVGFIQEKVPVSFEIMDQGLIIKNQETGEFEVYDGQFISQDEEDIRLLRWYDLGLKQNDELEIRYKFDAPDVSPDLHLLGPLGFYE